MAALLQAPILYWTYELEFGGMGASGFRPMHQANWLLFRSGVAVAALVPVSPILRWGDVVQKLLAGVLVPLPLLHFITAFCVIAEKCRWAYA